MKEYTIGYALCGSFCTFKNSISQMKKLIKNGFKVIPIMSFNAANTDTKFGKASDFKQEIEDICNRKIICTIPDAEPIGPKKMVDVMTICPCTGNTLAKLCNAITDTPVIMAAKSHLRIQKPVVIALATNDALGSSAQNIGKTINMKNIFFVPLKQDDPKNKPQSLVANFDLLEETINMAISNTQIQPLFQ